jgi:predicted Zn-dependent peptidase
VGVYVNAGSRNEDYETSGANYLLSKMFLRGTTSRSKTQIHQDIENMGAKWWSDAGREISSFSLKVFKQDVAKGLQTLGDLVSNNSWNTSEFELLKEEVSNEHEENHHRYEETTLENVHYNVFREH